MKRLKKYVLVLFLKGVLFFIAALPAFSQVDSYQFAHLGLEDGLSQATVNSIVQDDKGFLWFGTVGGLNRYDGRQMIVYRSDLIDNNSLSDKQVTDICIDTNSDLWISTVNGLSFFNIRTEQFRLFYEKDGPQSISDNSVNGVHCDSDGTVWLATDQGLNKLTNKQKGTFKSLEIRGEQQNFRELYRDKKGILWVGSFGAGLYYLDPEEEQFVSSELPMLDEKIVTSIHEGHGYLWVGTEAGLFRINENRTKVIIYQNTVDDHASLSNDYVNDIYQDSQSNLWIGTQNGLNLYQPDRDEFIRLKADPKDDQSLKSNRINSIYEDRHNTLWIGTQSNGISKFSYHQKGIKHYSAYPDDENSISDNNIWDFVEDENDNIWIGTDEGLNRFDPDNEQFDHFYHDPDNPNSLSNNRIYNIEIDRHRNLWISTADGLNKFDPQTERTERYLYDPDDKNSISYNILWGVDIDSSGNIWIGTRGRGLNVLNPETETFVHYNHDPNDTESLGASYVSDVFIDSRGQIWVGTQNGLNLYEPETKTFKKFPHTSENPHSLDTGIVIDIQEDANGRLWVGTIMGANVLDIESHEVLKHISLKDGLPDDIIWGITEDERGNIYMGTTLGLAVWDSETKTFNNFDKRDGLQGNEFNAGAAFTSSSGEIYMGGTNGFNKFSPSDLTGNPNPPPVVITDFQLYNESVPIKDSIEEDGERRKLLDKSITYTDTLTLSYADNVISFEFAALNFTIPEKNQYAYKLEGFDEKWNYIGNRNFVTYTELPPGAYTFRVKASNNDGVWNEEGTSLALVITPPFWQTTWFYLISALFIVGLVFTGYRLRVRSIKEYSRRLEKEVADRTDELNKKNRDLKSTLKELEETKDELVEKAHKAGMADIASGVLHNVGNILNSVNTSATVIKDTVRQSKVERLSQANELLREHIDRVEEFIAENPKGKQLLNYYLKLEEPIQKEQQKMLKQSQRLSEKVDLISEVIAAQQSYAGASIEADQASLDEMVNDALTLQSGSIERHGLTIKKDLQPIEAITAHRTQLIHILVNIFKNAKEAMVENEPEEKVIRIKTWQEDNKVHLSISDNGHGIKKENIDKIFTQGFTTKNEGHGFGLHSCANYMQSMGGKIKVESNGKGRGATFILVFPSSTNGNNSYNEKS
ncbi:histidine kinase [Aliifodinibius salipaludis]|uniref:histidine kinase n=1 Tax=Fodinibius salipaludis TaxID=2032627 RepID=A0A2A2GDE2_9BACT|nr:two-component regulator propeller domain-containing protein [Aliifodinibius salipaludis]PAU95561.1 histidine kinase [Aliifodinibius salipaludis]